jgi:predicted phosphodiesterase
MRKLSAFCLALLLAGCAAAEKEKTEYVHADFTAAVTSDLHYTASPSDFSSIVPLEPLSPQVTDALIAQVIAMKPDAFILTGDNTNNGKPEDVGELAAKLQAVRDAGIEVIMTAGNHDYGQGSTGMKAYEAYFLPLLSMNEKDPDSFSYKTVNGGVTVLAMDDSHAEDSDGSFSEETMAWLEKQLDEAEKLKSRVLFLSHHNIVCGQVSPMYSGYLVRNEGLYAMLAGHNAEICMSGHQHNQAVWHKDDMYEVLNGMPLQTGSFGVFTMNEEGFSYHTEPIDLKTYGEDGLYKKALSFTERQSAVFMGAFEKLCAEKNLSAEETERVIALVSRFFEASEQGTLAKEADGILHHEDYELMQSVLWDKNYGPWMEALLKDPPADASRLEFRWK